MKECLTKIEPVIVDSIPDELEYGTLYISQNESKTVHKCPCGCGGIVTTPLNIDNGWTITIDNGKVSILPSIRNWEFPCRSNYFIRENRIVWCK